MILKFGDPLQISHEIGFSATTNLLCPKYGDTSLKLVVNAFSCWDFMSETIWDKSADGPCSGFDLIHAVSQNLPM